MTEHIYAINDTVDVQVGKIQNFGAVVRLPNRKLGLIHISQVADEFVTNVGDYLKVGDKVTARVKKVTDDGKIDLTLKKKRQEAGATKTSAPQEKPFRISPFEEKLNEFLKRATQSESDGVPKVN